MKTFVLVPLLLLPTALSAQVLLRPSSSPCNAADADGVSFRSASTDSRELLAGKRPAERRPRVDYKLTIIRPRPRLDARMVVRPDTRYDYKILTPRGDDYRSDPPRRRRER